MAKANKLSLRIAKLPNLTPVKLTVRLEPEVHQMLEDYAQIYSDNYGEAVKPAELVPSMITGFLATDNGFKRARKTLKETG
mgnify:CR=1 FL=1